MRQSLYWDDFEKRVVETVHAIRTGQPVPVRRVAVFITERCNLKCDYCNHRYSPCSMDEPTFQSILERYGQTALVHITGGEPSTVPWLYPFLLANREKYRFHLNTNAVVRPPVEAIKRLKVSLDSCDASYWDDLVHMRGAFSKVVANIKEATGRTVVSITCTLTKENYGQSVEFARFVKDQFPGLYALFFSIYKGTKKRFAFDPGDVEKFWDMIPQLEQELSPESLALLRETMDEKRRLVQDVRFPENDLSKPCYISMSERVFGPDGTESACSHLYRDGVFSVDSKKCEKCLYGCNRRLVQFNEEVQRLLLALPS